MALNLALLLFLLILGCQLIIRWVTELLGEVGTVDESLFTFYDLLPVNLLSLFFCVVI